MGELLPFTDTSDGDDERTELLGTLLGITYRNEQNGYTVARMECERLAQPVTVVGLMPGVEVGDTLAVRGRWTHHPHYGTQLGVERCEVRMPTGRKGLVQFLGGGRIKGVGTKTAEKIVDSLGLDVLDRLQRNPSLLATVPGISASRASAITAQLDEQREAAASLVFLQEHGLGPATALRIWRTYGARTVEEVRRNPYQLAEDVFGVGFRTADGLARSLGLAADSAFRIGAGLHYLLARAALEGHVGLPAELLVERAAPFLELDEQAVERVLVECLQPDPRSADGTALPRLVEDGLVYRPDLHQAEVSLAAHVRRLLAGGPLPTDVDADAAIAWAEQRLRMELAEDQRAAARSALTHKVSVITGGPGVGKTTLVRCLVEILVAQGASVALAAPTGRAARRLEEATGRTASTLHRLLGLQPTTGFRLHRPEPLEFDVLIVDEASMVDVALADGVLSALPDSTSLVLVGDVDQLPSVGPGEVLRACIDSGVVPVARLSTIYRQARHSGIVRVAHELNAGRVPAFDEGPEGQAYWVERPDAAGAIEAIVALVTERIPRRYGLHPLRDVQVLTPMHKGPVGTVALNEVLREALNPPAAGKAEITRFGRLYREGDKVMQVRNNYDLDVFNGDVGLVSLLDEESQQVAVDFDGRRVEYSLDMLDQLEPAYAITCHKSQGSEFPAVLLPLFASQYMMLRRNLVYTAFTRARTVLVALGEWAALQRAVHTVDTGTRHSRLGERLRGE